MIKKKQERERGADEPFHRHGRSTFCGAQVEAFLRRVSPSLDVVDVTTPRGMTGAVQQNPARVKEPLTRAKKERAGFGFTRNTSRAL